MEISPTQLRSRTKLWIAAALLGLTGAGAVARRALAREAPATSPTAEPIERAVHAAPPIHGQMSHPIRAAGTTRATKQLDLAFLVGGEVTWVGVDVGAHVTRGQVIAKIDVTTFAAAAARAKANSAKATRELDRARTLHQSGSVPAATLEDATTSESIATAANREADFALRHGVIVAPDDGVIDARFVDPGEVAAAGALAFRLSGRAQGVVVRVGLSDRDVLGLEVGRPGSVRLDASPERALHAHVSRMASAASPESGTFVVDVHIDDDAAETLPTGLTAKVAIERTALPGAIVPVAALVPGDGDGTFVVAVDDGRAHKKPVKVLFFEGEQAALAEGLDGVAAVATDGALSLVEGVPVTRVR